MTCFLLFLENKHIKHNMVSGIFSSTWRAMKCQEYQGDVRQQGAEYILGPGSVFLQKCECVYVDKGGGGSFSQFESKHVDGKWVQCFPDFILAMFIMSTFGCKDHVFSNKNQLISIFSGEEVHFMHICENSTDQTPINDLLQLAGVKQVSFPNDTRVIDV